MFKRLILPVSCIVLLILSVWYFFLNYPYSQSLANSACGILSNDTDFAPRLVGLPDDQKITAHAHSYVTLDENEDDNQSDGKHPISCHTDVSLVLYPGAKVLSYTVEFTTTFEITPKNLGDLGLVAKINQGGVVATLSENDAYSLVSKMGLDAYIFGKKGLVSFSKLKKLWVENNQFSPRELFHDFKNDPGTNLIRSRIMLAEPQNNRPQPYGNGGTWQYYIETTHFGLSVSHGAWTFSSSRSISIRFPSANPNYSFDFIVLSVDGVVGFRQGQDMENQPESPLKIMAEHELTLQGIQEFGCPKVKKLVFEQSIYTGEIIGEPGMIEGCGFVYVPLRDDSISS